jgi:hypothetical protein
MLTTGKSVPVRFGLLFALFAILACVQVFGEPQAKEAAAPAPVPAQINAAKKVFICNAGGENGSEGPMGYSGEADRTYNQFYAAVKSWGRYEPVSAPADADLLLEIRFSVVPAGAKVFKGDTVGPQIDPQFRLIIRDPRTQSVLWAFTEHAQTAILQGNRDKNFDQALERIVTDLKTLAGRAAITPDDTKK